MAYSWTEGTYSAGVQSIPCDIDYLDKSYIYVYLDGVLTTAYTWASDTVINLTTALTAETTVLLVRRTDKEDLYIKFASGAAFTVANMDSQNIQYLHLAQEMVEGRSVEGFYGEISHNGYRITEVGAPTDDTDATNKAYVDILVANTDANTRSYVDSIILDWHTEYEIRMADVGLGNLGSFEDTNTYTLINNRQTLAYQGHYYSWYGAFPKTVTGPTTPALSGGISATAWVDVNVLLYMELTNKLASAGWGQSSPRAVANADTNPETWTYDSASSLYVFNSSTLNSPALGVVQLVRNQEASGGTISALLLGQDGLLRYRVWSGATWGAWVVQDSNLRGQLAGTGSAALIGDAISDIVVGKIPKFGNTSGIPTLKVPSTNGQRLFIEKQVTTADDLTALQLHRNATYSGGTTGYVGSALLVQTDVAATAYGTFEWAGLFIVNNSSPNTQNSENVAIYAQGNKKSTGRTWAGCLEITDTYNGSGSTVTNNEATIGLEITCRGSGLDNATTPQRMGLHVAITSNNAGEWGNGVIVGTDANSFWRYGVNVTGRGNNSAFHASVTTNTSSNCALLRDESTALTLGVDTSGAVYSSGFAMRMALGQKIALDVNGTNTITAGSSGIVLNTVVNMSASFAIPSANRSTTATAGGVASLPATASGFINFKMDGTTYKIPYYAA